MNVGGVYEYRKTADEDSPVYLQVPKARQASAVNWLNQNVFSTPEWLLEPSILERIDPVGTMENIRSLQLRTLSSLLGKDRLLRLMEQKALYPVSAFSLEELMSSIRDNIWSELKNTQTPDAFRRNLQRGYLDVLSGLMKDEDAKVTESDIQPVIRQQLKTLRSDVASAINRSSGLPEKKGHLEDVLVRIDLILHPKN